MHELSSRVQEDGDDWHKWLRNVVQELNNRFNAAEILDIVPTGSKLDVLKTTRGEATQRQKIEDLQAELYSELSMEQIPLTVQSII